MRAPRQRLQPRIGLEPPHSGFSAVGWAHHRQWQRWTVSSEATECWESPSRLGTGPLETEALSSLGLSFAPSSDVLYITGLQWTDWSGRPPLTYSPVQPRPTPNPGEHGFLPYFRSFLSFLPQFSPLDPLAFLHISISPSLLKAYIGILFTKHRLHMLIYTYALEPSLQRV